MFTTARRFTILLGLALLIPACSSMSNMSKMQKLEDSLRAYEGAIRWNEFAVADEFGGNDQPAPSLAQLDNIKVTAYKVKTSKSSKEKLEANQTVVVRYYDLNGMTEQSTVHKQHWRYDEDKKRWLVSPSLPSF